MRARPTDIAVLAHFFLTRYADGRTFSSDAIDLLQRYEWPGNIRELKNAVARVAMHTEDAQITAADLRLHAGLAQSAPDANRVPALAGLERDQILKALETTGGDRVKTCELLGIPMRTLARRVVEYDVQLRKFSPGSFLGELNPDQRKYFRVEVRLPVSLVTSSGQCVQATSLNISSTGLSVNSSELQNVISGPLRVSFHLPQRAGTVRADGRCIWVDGKGRAGIKLSQFHDNSQATLDQWVEKYQQREGWLTKRHVAGEIP